MLLDRPAPDIVFSGYLTIKAVSKSEHKTEILLWVK